MTKLLLASASIRRKELLDQIGVKYETKAMDIDESVYVNEVPEQYVQRLAKEKALAALEIHSDMLVLAADTTVVVDGNILGKPENDQDAKHMLIQLSDSTHYVFTGIAVAKTTQGNINIEAQVVQTEVKFAELKAEEIDSYIKTGEPMGKAGAYGIQGKAALFIEGMQGSYSNVVGLPLAETGKLLQRFGYPVW